MSVLRANRVYIQKLTGSSGAEQTVSNDTLCCHHDYYDYYGSVSSRRRFYLGHKLPKDDSSIESHICEAGTAICCQQRYVSFTLVMSWLLKPFPRVQDVTDIIAYVMFTSVWIKKSSLFFCTRILLCPPPVNSVSSLPQVPQTNNNIYSHKWHYLYKTLILVLELTPRHQPERRYTVLKCTKNRYFQSGGVQIKKSHTPLLPVTVQS